VDAGLRRHQPEGILASQREGHALEPRFLTGLILENGALEPPPLGPLEIHAQQHLGPVLRLDAAGTGVDGHNRVGRVVLAAEHLLDLAGVHHGLEAVERPGQVGLDRFPLLGPFNEHLQIIALLPQGITEVDVFADALSPAQGGLCVGGLVPEIGSGDAGFESAQFFVETGPVKDSSAGQRPA